MMTETEEFIEDLAKEDVSLRVEISLTEHDEWKARIVDPDCPWMDVLDRRGDMILSCSRPSIEEALKALNTLCSTPAE